jgi:hypothetical protein
VETTDELYANRSEARRRTALFPEQVDDSLLFGIAFSGWLEFAPKLFDCLVKFVVLHGAGHLKVEPYEGT